MCIISATRSHCHAGQYAGGPRVPTRTPTRAGTENLHGLAQVPPLGQQPGPRAVYHAGVVCALPLQGTAAAPPARDRVRPIAPGKIALGTGGPENNRPRATIGPERARRTAWETT